jgi:hypothetical protein
MNFISVFLKGYTTIQLFVYRLTDWLVFITDMERVD